MNLWDILILALLGIIVFFTLRKLIRDARCGKSCCGDCSQCTHKNRPAGL